jgi:ABC-type glycerol-3-phosphate transport system substrate-binding protein
VTKDGKFGFNNPAAYKGLQRFADLALVNKVTPPDFGSQKDSDVKGGFQNKQYAMIVDATGFAPTLVSAKVNFEIYPHPTVNGNKLTVGAVGLIGVAKIKDNVKRQAAMDLGRYLTSNEVQIDVPPGSNVPTGFYLAPGARKSASGMTLVTPEARCASRKIGRVVKSTSPGTRWIRRSKTWCCASKKP